jgi:hypothetical protein
MRHLVATKTKFVAGTKAYRLWVETDDEHRDVGETFDAHIQVGRRVVFPESRFGGAPPVQIEEYTDGGKAAVAHTGKVEGPSGGVRVYDDYPAGEDGEPAGDAKSE